MLIAQKIKFFPVFIAGLLGIAANMILLKIATLLSIKAESGGLLKLMFKIIPSLFAFPALHSELFWLFFHVLTGTGMILLYFLWFAQLPINKWIKGCLFSFFPWIVNGFVVLPLLGQGIMGIHILPVSGITYFFFANLVFALILSVLSETHVTYA